MPGIAWKIWKKLGDIYDLLHSGSVEISNPISGFATEAKQLADDHNVTVSNPISGFATSAKQLADGHNVAVSNLDANKSVALTALDQTYDASPTTDVSANIDAEGYRTVCLSYEIDKANTPTDILFEVEVSLDGTNWSKLMNGFLGDLRYDDVAVGAGIEESLVFEIACNKIRVRITCQGTDGTHTFTVDNAILYFRN